ncbi:hypothetical protein ACFWBV_04685 [Streptomyces sp. NPDC060030]|uniref:hypothetical protein n=1 Tax=Streptomyces sp. NPDC060030 TaxID=3347042 RepID=UPI0036CE75AE
MVRAKKQRTVLTRERRPALRLTGLDAQSLASRLYELHERESRRPGASDPAVEALSYWPGDASLYNVLLWGQKHAGHLSAESAQEGAVIRTQLAQLLREQLEPLQLRAVEDARKAGVEWERLAPALAVTTVTGAYNKARRLAVAVHGTPEDRRSPEAARALEGRLAAEIVERRQTEEREEARYPLVLDAARSLLAAFERDELCVNPEDYWITELEDVIDDRVTPRERATLALILRNAGAEVQRNARSSGRAAASTEEARVALQRVVRLLPHP